jgi:ubiquitin C-terminal hydrolase
MLCIHIKRFKHDSILGSKIGDHVNFPLDGLDMTPFCVTSEPLKDDPFDNDERRNKLKEQPVTYDLCGIVNHSGSLSGGHCTSKSSFFAQAPPQLIGSLFF